MKLFTTKLFIAASVVSLAAATPQLGGLPTGGLPVCLDGTSGGTLPALPSGLNLVSCSEGQTCTPMTAVLNSVPILGAILGGIINEIPVGVGMCT